MIFYLSSLIYTLRHIIVASIHKQESVTSPVTTVAGADAFDLAGEEHAVGIRSAAVTAAPATRTTVTQTFIGNVTHIRYMTRRGSCL